MLSTGAVGDPPQHCSVPPQGHLRYTQEKPIHPAQQLRSEWCNSERKGCQLPRKDDHNNLSRFIIRGLLRLSGGQKDNRHPHRMDIGCVPQFGNNQTFVSIFPLRRWCPPQNEWQNHWDSTAAPRKAWMNVTLITLYCVHFDLIEVLHWFFLLPITSFSFIRSGVYLKTFYPH